MNWTDTLFPGKPQSVDQKAAELRNLGYSEVDEWEIGAWPSPIESLGHDGQRIVWCPGRQEFYRVGESS